MTVLLVIHLIIILCLIVVILLQRSSAEGFTGGGESFMSSRGKASFMTRATAILATMFIVNSIILAYYSSHISRETSIIEKIENKQVEVEKEEKPKEEQKPAVPLAD